MADKRLTGKRNIRVATMNSCMHVEILDGNLVRVDMGLPTFDPLKIPFKAERQSDRYTIEHALGTNEFGVVSMGNPHAVLVVDDIQSAPVAQLGPLIEQHAQFPARVNVGFMEVVSDAVIKLRVVEVGGAAGGEGSAVGGRGGGARVEGRREARRLRDVSQGHEDAVGAKALPARVLVGRRLRGRFGGVCAVSRFESGPAQFAAACTGVRRTLLRRLTVRAHW